MYGIARDRKARTTDKWQVLTGVDHATILEPLAVLAGTDLVEGCPRGSAMAVLEDMPNLPQGGRDAGQGSNVGDAEDPANDLLA
ncbi:MAG: hypothetical protein VX527_11525 [Planctomycetota bacterium]|nr:hypothetical protein [Planctomycetota bacterium]